MEKYNPELKYQLSICSSRAITAKCEYHSHQRVLPETKACLNQHLPILLTLLEAKGQYFDFQNAQNNRYSFEYEFPREYHHLLWYGILEHDCNTIKRLFQFKPNQFERSDYAFNDCWDLALNENDDTITDLLITNFTPKELQQALFFTIKTDCNPNIMQKLITHGADPSLALEYPGRVLVGDRNCDSQKWMIENITFLAGNGGFNQKTINLLQEYSTLLTSLIDLINKNKPLSTTEQKL